MKRILKSIIPIAIGILILSMFGTVHAYPVIGGHVGTPIPFTVTVTGLPPPLTYYWGAGVTPLSALVAAVNNGPTHNNHWTWTPTATGTYYIVVEIFDSRGDQISFYPLCAVVVT